MSTPIYTCDLMKALVDEETYQNVLKDLKYNLQYSPAFTIIQCQCDPPCHETYNITDEMLLRADERLNKDLDEFQSSLKK